MVDIIHRNILQRFLPDNRSVRVMDTVIKREGFYGFFVRRSDITPAAGNTAYPVVFTDSNGQNRLTVDSAAMSNIVIPEAGIYIFESSMNAYTAASVSAIFYSWFAIDGVDIGDTMVVKTVPNTTQYSTIRNRLIQKCREGQIIELMYAVSNSSTYYDYLTGLAFGPDVPSARVECWRLAPV